jgi:putative spermidine/putrescine transport system permease protein
LKARGTSAQALAFLPGLFLLFGLGIPLVWILLLGLGFPKFSFSHFKQVFEDETYALVLWRTFAIAGTSTLIALALGYPIALTLAQASATWRAALLWFVLLPLWTNLLVRTYAWMVILTTNGPANKLLMTLGVTDHPLDLAFNRTGTIIGLTHSVLPYVTIPIYAALLKIDPQLLRAAQSLGSRPASAFFKVTLPLSLPGVGAGCVLGFVLGLAAFVIPALLGGPRDRMAGMLIESTANRLLDWNLAAALAVVLLLVTLIAVYVQARVLGVGALFGLELRNAQFGRTLRILHRGASLLRRAFSYSRALGQRAAIRTSPAHQSESALWRHIGSIFAFDRIIRIIASAGFAFLALPLLIVIPISFSSSQFLQFPPTGFSLQWYERYLTSGPWLTATATSILIAALVVIVSLLVGSAAAISVVRAKGRGKVFLAMSCLIPLVIPNIVLAVAFFFLFSKIGLVGTVGGLVVAHSVLSLPLVFVTMVAGLHGIDPDLPRAAAVLGANPARVIFKIIVPLMWTSIITAALFAFVHSFDEIVVALFLTSLSVTTLPKLIWENLVMYIDPTISAVSTLLILLASITVVMAQKKQGRKR